MTTFPTPDRHDEVTYSPATGEELLRDRVKRALREREAAARDSAATPACDMDVAQYLRTLNNGPRA